KDTTDIKEASLHNTEQLRNIINYANFLKQPLKLGMFIPCDEDGNVLERPELYLDKVKYVVNDTLNYKYQQALSNVIFKIDNVEKEFNTYFINFDNHLPLSVFHNGSFIGQFGYNGKKVKTIEDLTDLGIELIKDKI
ncbi:MAG: hypothetical protein GY739_11830, partial [Mesoflavibacter sp.]|nr:hypothetical protein [Mesoflavibacter sp.]